MTFNNTKYFKSMSIKKTLLFYTMTITITMIIKKKLKAAFGNNILNNVNKKQ